MAAKEVHSKEDIQALVSSHERAVVIFVAPWERGSRELADHVAHKCQTTSLGVALLDVSQDEELAFDLGVSFLPYLACYRGPNQVQTFTERDKDTAISRVQAFTSAMDEDLKPLPLPKAPEPPRRPTTLPILAKLLSSKPLKLFVAGDRSKVGKSSVCLGMLGSLLRAGLRPQDLAYIKPATQCEGPQLVTKYCTLKGVENRGIGPVVFYKGFTREFLKGNMGTSQDLLADIKASVDEISKGKKFVLIDGVGYPAVGSICGISNADIAQALDLPVVIVGRAGVGDAVDSFNLNATFFTSRNLRVLGGLFNRLPLEGFYSLEACKEAVTDYFHQFQPHVTPYGFLPELPALITVREQIEKGAAAALPTPEEEEEARMQLAETFIDTFYKYVNLEKLLVDLYGYFYNGQGRATASGATTTTTTTTTTTPNIITRPPPPPPIPVALPPPSRPPQAWSIPAVSPDVLAPLPGRKRKTREEIEQEARKQGAKSGG